jgi:hypothetical protein
MAFEELKEQAENIQGQTQQYIESSVDYYKLRAFKLAMKSTTLILKYTLVGIGLMIVLLFCSVAGALAIGKELSNNALGFLIVGGIYLALTGLLFLVKDKIIDGPILEKFSEIFFND